MRKVILLAVVFLLISMFVFSSCTPQTKGNQAIEQSKHKIALVVSDSLGDKAFFDLSNTGVQKAVTDFNLEAKLFECNSNNSLYAEKLIEASKYADIVVTVGYEFYDILKDISVGYPNINYIYVDQLIEGSDNISCLDYNEKEGAFLAGALASLLTTDLSIAGINEAGKIGIVGGMDIPVIKDFVDGYMKGAKYINSDIIVETALAGSFTNPEKGYEWASTLYQQDIDIVFAVAGAAGNGVFDAAQEYGKYAIGVDIDQRYINEDVIIASMTKAVDLSIYESIKKILEGSFESGAVYSYGISKGGVNITYGDNTMKQIVPDTIKAEINRIKQDIISSKIKIQ